jgi:hypothetical protein
LVVIPEGDLLLFVVLAISFLTFRPEIACQAPQPYNQFRINNILMEKSTTPTAIIETEGKKSRKARLKNLGFLTLTQPNEDFTSRGLDCKDFRTAQQRSPGLNHLQ